MSLTMPVFGDFCENGAVTGGQMQTGAQILAARGSAAEQPVGSVTPVCEELQLRFNVILVTLGADAVRKRCI